MCNHTVNLLSHFCAVKSFEAKAEQNISSPFSDIQDPKIEQSMRKKVSIFVSKEV